MPATPMMPRLAALALVATLGVLGCRAEPLRGAERLRPNGGPIAGRDSSGATPATGQVYALLINGGGSADRNYQSHMLHVHELVELLESRGVARERIVVFASDGTDPAPDLAVLDEKPEKHFYLIDSLPVGARLRPEIQLVDSHVRGVQRQPATRKALFDWFQAEAPLLEPGSTLLIYVTDHGHRNRSDDKNNSIVLWGEELSVQDLRGLLAQVPREVRTVMLMSQCFSGSFANVLYGSGGTVASDTNVCGFFSSPADRYAYGCYPENRGKENVGHSFQFLEALRIMGSFDLAHDAILVTDNTPDVPNRTSGHYLNYLVQARAGSFSLGYEEFADSLLEQAWGDEIHYAAEFARIDEIGRQFGAFGPRTFAELGERTRNLPELRADLSTMGKRWEAAYIDLKRENFERFLAATPSWAETLAREKIEELAPRQRRTLRRELLADLSRHTQADRNTETRLKVLRSMAREAKAGAYRMEVRIAASLRIRDALSRIAGEAYVDRYATHAERSTYDSLRECESFALEPDEPVLARLERAAPFPTLETEAKLLAAVLPGWLGVEFRALEGGARSQSQFDAGAVTVTKVYLGSPAERAGIVKGDILLGPPGDHFTERNQVREWVMTSMIDQTLGLDVFRDGHIRTVSVRIGAPPSSSQ